MRIRIHGSVAGGGARKPFGTIDLEKEIDLLLAGRCDPETVRDCDGKTLRALCARCGKNGKLRGWGAHYAASLLRVHLLQEAGFRFENDSFDLQFWLDMAFLKRKILTADFR